MSTTKPTVYLTTPVFHEIAKHEKVSQNWKTKILSLWGELHDVAHVIVAENRFPSAQEIEAVVKTHNVDFIGCHLSHPITDEAQKNPSVKAVCTSTAGFNHISTVPGIVYTHTPSVLDKTVADFTIAMILTNLRNLIPLHNFLWDGKWSADQKWDLDENLNNTMDNLVVGIVGLGEIGREVVSRLAPWGVKMVYFDLQPNAEFDAKYPNLAYRSNMEDIFEEADIVSLHIPLNPKTTKIVGESLLRKMKKNALLVNTARGPIVDFPTLLKLLKSREIAINLAFDVFDPEPISSEVLKEFKAIMTAQPDRRFVFIPHNASSDADTRAEMSCILLSDLITLVKGKSLGDLSTLHFIPNQRKFANPDPEAEKEFQAFRFAQQ